MFCRYCGKEIDEQDAFCRNCGAPTGDKIPPEREKKNIDDRSSFGWGVLAFFFPLIGIILYAVWRSEYPLRAKSLLIGFITGLIVDVALTVLSQCALVGLFACNPVIYEYHPPIGY